MIVAPAGDIHTVKRTFTIAGGPIHNGMRVRAVVVTYTHTGSRWTPVLPSHVVIIGNVIGKRGETTVRRRREKVTAHEHDRMDVALPWLYNLIRIYAPHGTAVAQDKPRDIRGAK